MSGVTIQEAVTRLKAFGSDALPRATRAAIYRALDTGRKRSLDTLARSTMGTMVRRRGDVQMKLRGAFIGPTFGSREGGALSSIPLIVQRLPIEESYASGRLGIRTYSSGLRTMGFAALIEQGGKTKRHTIKPIRAEGYSRKRGLRVKQLLAERPMRFQIGGRWVAVRLVSHPGSRVPRTPFMASGGAAAQQALPREFDRSVGDALRSGGL